MSEAGKQEMLPLLLEIGCEEIPARFLRNAERSLGELVQAAISEARLLPEATRLREPALRTYSTPRRLVVHLPALLARQPDKVEEIVGPPIKVAVNAEGQYTRAAESFAQKNSARLEDLIRKTTPKGEYLALRKTTEGQAASSVLAEILPAAVLRLGFPKSMYWIRKSGPRFVRPIRWVLAVLGEGKRAEAVCFEVLGVASGDLTFGHRVYSKRAVQVKSFRDYGAKLRRACVEFDPEIRRQVLRAKTKALLEVSLVLIENAELEEWLVDSTEWPSAVRGGFDERFLHLPREILITVMRDHQKYFAVQNHEAALEPFFIAILNVDSDDRGLIRQGHERVLKARFSDAEFFWDADQRVPLRERLPLLEKVTYEAKLGSYADKLRRMVAIAERLCDKLIAQGMLEVGQREHVLRAVELSKCDLTTQMVQEFAELQGVVGGLYARAQGEHEVVAEAVYDHYLPHGAEDKCPRSVVGALVSLSDKLDAVVAGFAVGNGPTGSSDPFAIRRQANGIIKVILDISAAIDLDSEVVLELASLREKLTFDSAQVAEAVRRFLRERLTFHLETVIGLRYDTVRAAMGALQGGFEPSAILARAKAVERIRSSDDFVSLSQSARRIRNILNKSAQPSDFEGGNFDPHSLEPGPEQDLYGAYEGIREEAARKRSAGDLAGALESVSSLRPAVDLFFDKVLVMATDPEVRRNRLQLLIALDRLFTEDADLSQIENVNVDASTSAHPQQGD